MKESILHTPGEAFRDHLHNEETSFLGMWVFLASEVLFFGAGIATYILMRFHYSSGFGEGSQEMNLLLGSINTVILLISSAAVAAAEKAAEAAKPRVSSRFMLAGACLGLVFLCIKAYEYLEKYHHAHIPGLHFNTEAFSEPAQVQLFFWLYFALTSLHFMHVLLGVVWAFGIAWLIRKRSLQLVSMQTYALYWHFVDIVWIFLFPAFYLIG